MGYTPTFWAAKNVGTTLTALGASYTSGPCVAVLSAIADFYANYDDATNTNRFFVESSGQPFKIVVDDLSKLHLASLSSTVNVFVMTYPIGTVIP